MKRLAVLGLLALSACDMPSMSGGTRVEVDGFDILVAPVRGQMDVYEARHVSRSTRQDSGFYARHVIAIRNVSGCRVDARAISHEGTASTARVLC